MGPRREYDMSSTITKEKLIAAGGRAWEHRVYFNELADLFGLKCSYYNTGNVSSARLHGKKVSNSHARDILKDFEHAWLYYDTNAGAWVSGGALSKGDRDLIIEEIKHRMSGGAQ